jgi:hypothetical protein
VATRTRTRRRPRRTTPGRPSGNGALELLGRAGFLARGVMYVVIGWIALQIAFGQTRQQADRTGALHALSATPFGVVALWVLVVGFFGMAVWRLSEAVWPVGEERKAAKRVAAVAKAVVYAVLGYGTLKYAIGAGAPQSSNNQSVDLTATVLRHPGGQAVVVVIGLALIGGGLYLGYQAWRERFRRELELGRMSRRARRIVEWLGRRDRPRHRVRHRGRVPGGGRRPLAAPAGQGGRLRPARARGDPGRPLAARPRRDRADHVRPVLVLRGALAPILSAGTRSPRGSTAFPPGANATKGM